MNKALKLTVATRPTKQTADDKRVYHALDVIADAFNPDNVEEVPGVYQGYLDKGKGYAALCIRALDQAVELGWSATVQEAVQLAKGKPEGFRPKPAERKRYLPVLACQLLRDEMARQGTTLRPRCCRSSRVRNPLSSPRR